MAGNQSAPIGQWRESLYENGVLKADYEYGEARHSPIQDNLVVACVRGAKIQKAAPYLNDLMSELCDAAARGFEVVVFAWQGFFKKWKTKYSQVAFFDSDDPSKPNYLAKASRVIVVGFLPNYFSRRDGQEVVQLWAEPQGLLPDHETLARGFISQLLNTTHIIVQDMPQATRVLDQYRLRNIYAGCLRVWSGNGSFAGGVVANLLSDGGKEDSSWPGFEIVSNIAQKPRILMYTRLLDELGYATFALRLASSIDFKRYDVTVLFNRHPWSEEEAKAFNRYPDAVRLISRVGVLSFDPESYVKAQLSFKGIGQSDDYLSWSSSLDSEAFRSEVRRIVGDAEFDQLVYCDVATPLWYVLADSMNVERCVKIELSRFMGVDETFARWHPIPLELEAQADSRLFEKVYLSDDRYIDSASKSYPDISFGFASLPVDAENFGIDVDYTDAASMGDRRFVFVGLPDGDMKRKGSLLPYPDRMQTNYLIEVQEDELEQVVDAIASQSGDREWHCVVLGGCSSATRSIIERTYPQRVEIVGEPLYLGACCETLTKYASLFDVCVVDRSTASKALGYAVRCIGQRLAVYSEGRFELEVANESSGQELLLEAAHECAEKLLK